MTHRTALVPWVCLLAACIVCLGLGVQTAQADPLRMGLTSKVSAPDRPTLSLTADESVTELRIDVEPDTAEGKPAESAAQSFKEKKLAAGKKITFPIGSGKTGTTRWHGMIQCLAGGKLWKRSIDFETEVTTRLEIRFDPNYYSKHINLAEHYVEVQFSAPAARGEITVTADDGSDVGSGHATFSDDPPGTWLRLSWTPRAAKNPESVVLRLAIKLQDSTGNSSTLDLYPWAVSVPHVDVSFATASWDISDSERAKLDESLAKINAILDRVERTLLSFAERGIVATPPRPKLYVNGHTDTVGSDPDNLTLSRNRARAIATYFHQRGFRMPIYFAGCGERQLRIKTADNTDEARNRHADYTLALESPPLPAGIAWLPLNPKLR
ncbi:MAG: OmpA family protein [Myxococcales bacterium]|nr:OmpA family protein [Myxococcales bacterium]